MKGRIEIRPMAVGDLREVYLLGSEFFADQVTPFEPAWTEENLADVYAGAGDLCIVAVAKKNVIGFVMASPEESGSAQSAVIRWIYTRENRPDGLLTDMLNSLQVILIEKNIHKIVITLPEKNSELIDYYRNFGFTESNRFIIMENFSPEKS